MPDADVFARCAALRVALADLLDSLDEQQLATTSLCDGWDVRTVGAHLTVLPTVSKLAFGRAMLRARGNFASANDAVAREVARRPVDEISALLREHAASRAVPPVGGARAPLTDLLVHDADIRLPLGLAWEPDPADVQTALDFLSTGPFGFLPRGRLDGLRLLATDLDRHWGDGAEVCGTAPDLLLGVCGRHVADDRLTGPGADLLRLRL